MASTIFSFSVKEADIASINRIEKLNKYAESQAMSFSELVVLALEKYEPEIDRLWQPRIKKKN